MIKISKVLVENDIQWVPIVLLIGISFFFWRMGISTQYTVIGIVGLIITFVVTLTYAIKY